MKTILQNIQDKLVEIPELRYIDEDSGQLNMFQPPVAWPCCLIDISDIGYSNMGIDRSRTPQNRQMGRATIKLTVANLKLTNTSGAAPQSQKDKAWFIWELIQKIHDNMQGFSPDTNAGRMLRAGLAKSNRDDGVQEYFITYSCEITNV